MGLEGEEGEERGSEGEGEVTGGGRGGCCVLARIESTSRFLMDENGQSSIRTVYFRPLFGIYKHVLIQK